MNGKVSRLFQNRPVQEILREALEMDFVEVLVVGKAKDGTRYLRKSTFGSTLEVVGELEMAKQWLLETME